MSRFIPGDRIESRCTRCRDLTGHVIMAMVGDEIIKVECRACGSVHKYYPPEKPKKSVGKDTVYRVKSGEDRQQAVAVAAQASARANAVVSRAPRETTKTRKQAGTSEELEQSWRSAMNATVAAPKPYSIDTVFAVGDVMEHSVFGAGVVQSVEPPNKIIVAFREGLKALRASC